ncbi:MAG: 4Fe-4S binding protein [Planctomycetota bacterium]|jgi:ferredoxin-type protein NapH
MKPSVQWLRHTVQALVLLFVFMTAAIGWYGSNLNQGAVDRVLESDGHPVATHVVATIDRAVRPEDVTIGKSRRNEAAHEKLNHVQGNSWTGKWFGVSLTDPLGGVESTVSQKSLTLALLTGLAIPVGFTLLVGRVFCSWICPAGFLFEINAGLRHLAARVGVEMKNVRLWRGHKYVLLAVGLAASALVAIPLLQYLYPPAILTRETHHLVGAMLDQAAGPSGGAQASQGYTGVVTYGGAITSGGSGDSGLAGRSPAWGLSGWAAFLLAIFVVEYLVVTRAWCRYLCPGGALYSLIGWRRPIRVVRRASRCTNCAECVPVCPMGLNPMADQMGPECDNCLECISHCPDDALDLRFTLKTHAPKTLSHSLREATSA